MKKTAKHTKADLMKDRYKTETDLIKQEAKRNYKRDKMKTRTERKKMSYANDELTRKYKSIDKGFAIGGATLSSMAKQKKDIELARAERDKEISKNQMNMFSDWYSLFGGDPSSNGSSGENQTGSTTTIPKTRYSK